MTESAWLFLIAAWAVIIVNTGYCFFKLLTSKRQLNGDDQS